MRILQFTTDLRVAGAERVIASLSCELRKRGHDVGVVSIMPHPQDEAGTVLPQLRKGGVELHSLNVTKATPWRLRRLKKIVREYHPDIIHSHLIHANVSARCFAYGLGVPIVNTVHIAESRPGAWWHFWLDKATLKRCTVQTAVSHSVADFHARKIRVDPDFLPVIANGISAPAECDAQRRETLRNEWQVDGCSKVIGSVGRLDSQKGYDRLLEAASELAKKIPPEEIWAVVIMGEGPQRQHLAALASRTPDNIRIFLPGFRQDAADCIGAFDLFVMPSHYEGFGLTLAEAMGHGIPIMAADLKVLREVSQSYPSIVFCSFDSPVQTAETMQAALQLPRATPFKPFSLEKMTDQYMNLYRSLLKPIVGQPRNTALTE